MKQYHGFWLVLMFSATMTVDLYHRGNFIWAALHLVLTGYGAYIYARYLLKSRAAQ